MVSDPEQTARSCGSWCHRAAASVFPQVNSYPHFLTGTIGGSPDRRLTRAELASRAGNIQLVRIWTSWEGMRAIVAGLALEGNDAPVLPPAAQLARQRKARRILVHVVDPMTPADEEPSEGLDADVITTICETDAKNEFGTTTAGRDPGIQVERVAARGTPFEVGAILMLREKAGLVISGPGKAGNMREKVFGSTTDRIVRSSGIPILVAK